jgi:hypothetical protein
LKHSLRAPLPTLRRIQRITTGRHADCGQSINDRAMFPKVFEVSLRELVSSELTLS